MAVRFYYNINERPDNEGCQVYLLVSPGHYGRGLSVFYSNIELIKTQIEKGKLTYDPQKVNDDSDMILLEEISEPQIEIGDTEFDKRVMRTLMEAKVNTSMEVLEGRLQEADFFKGLPNSF